MDHINPYFIGFKMFEDIFIKDMERIKYLKLGQLERDESFIRKYLTEELCEELNLFEYAAKDGNYVVKEVADESGLKNIRNTLASNPAVLVISHL